MYTCLLYNVNISTSVTSSGRSLISSASMFFESFLANNVKFGSLDELLQFIQNIVSERQERTYSDSNVLDDNVSVVDCFAKMVLSCGYRWIPNESELQIIWNVIENLPTEDRNRVYYKNNLYEFVENSKVFGLVRKIMKEMKRPLLFALNPTEEIIDDLKEFSKLIMEYVYYHWMYIDRIDRCDNMIKSVIAVSDTDSCIVSLDAWYRYCAQKLDGEKLQVADFKLHPLMFDEKDEDEKWKNPVWRQPIHLPPKEYDYNFVTDEIVEVEHQSHPEVLLPNDNVRYSIINILAYVIDKCTNDYMERYCINNHSIMKQLDGKYNRACKIILKNEFTFSRLMMTQVKKNYASMQVVQEGNMVPENKQLDVKGIEILTKSSTSKSTRKALQKILLEDIMKAPVIDQLKFIKDVAIFEKRLIESIRNGSREYFKPVTVKSVSSYSDPMRIQGIKASIAWNSIKSPELPTLNLDERNAVDIVKVTINKATADKIEKSYPQIYENIMRTLDTPEFKGSIDAVALPLDTPLPDWLDPFINYDEILNNNIAGFPFESIGIMRMDKNIGYTNIIKI